MAIESKNLLVWVKAMSRGQALPLDASEVHASLSDAQAYASSAIAYPGQTIKALLEDGKYHEYILQPSDAGYVLEEVGGTATSTSSKQYVMVVDALPTSNQEQGILYIDNINAIGYVWTGSGWREVFRDVQPSIDQINATIGEMQTAINGKASIENPNFTVTVNNEEVALKSYVEALFAQLNESSSAPGIVDSTTPLPTEYKAGATYRVAEAGVYAGVQCEIGDLILVIKDYVAETASNDDFMVLQSNIDGAVTSAASTVTVGEIVVFDSVTGKVIKGSGIQIASLEDAITKAHAHSNWEILETYNKNQSDLLAFAKSEAQAIVDETKSAIDAAIANKADKATTLEGYGITDAYTKGEIDASLQVITDNLNTKVDAVTVDQKIADAKTETLNEASAAANAALETRVGAIPADTTIKSYIDTAVGTGGTTSAEAIATAKQEAIEASNAYTDTQIAAALEVKTF